jgi:hypothetical protein
MNARLLWQRFEPLHAVTYFAPEARAAYEEAGLRGYWRGYFAGRAAPLGAVDAAPAIALFASFAPRMVARALPDIWTRATPERALRARLDGATAALDRLLGPVTSGVREAADLLQEAATGLDLTGRALGAANAALPWPDGDEPVARLWQAATVLREHRGDGHVAALVAAGVDGLGALVWRAGVDGMRELLQPNRGWTDEEWDAAAAGLVERGWLEADGTATAAGRAAHAEMEVVTDRAAAGPWRALGLDRTARLAELLLPLTRAAGEALPYPNPVGVSPP